MTTNWKISRRARRCAACGAEFAEGESHYSLLRLDEGLRRFDRCASCFAASPPEPTEFFWRTRFVREARRRLAIDVEALRDAFVSLPPEGERAELRYLIALLLLRKRAFRLVETKRGEGEVPDRLVLRAPKGDGNGIEVAVPPLSAERIERLRTELRVLLGIEEQGSESTASGEPTVAVEEPGKDP